MHVTSCIALVAWGVPDFAASRSPDREALTEAGRWLGSATPRRSTPPASTYPCRASAGCVPGTRNLHHAMGSSRTAGAPHLPKPANHAVAGKKEAALLPLKVLTLASIALGSGGQPQLLKVSHNLVCHCSAEQGGRAQASG